MLTGRVAPRRRIVLLRFPPSLVVVSTRAPVGDVAGHEVVPFFGRQAGAGRVARPNVDMATES